MLAMVCGFFAHALRLDDVVPVDLRVRKTKKRAHELRDSTAKL